VLHIIDDVQELKPSFFVGVPRVYDKIYGKIVNLLPQQQGKLRWWLFRRAVASMEKTLRTGTPLPLVFSFLFLFVIIFIIIIIFINDLFIY
jgi:long-subunit acyl-CoA synthetase (AMP-forming)